MHKVQAALAVQYLMVDLLIDLSGGMFSKENLGNGVFIDLSMFSKRVEVMVAEAIEI